MSQNYTRGLVVDQTGNLWIGTTGGLDKFDRENEQFMHYTLKNGLPSDTIYGILEDGQGHLWFSTTNGLSWMTTVRIACS